MSIIWTARNITLSELVSTWPQYFYAAFSKLVACKKINKKNKFNAREERNIWIKLIVSYRGKIIHDRTIHSNHYLCTCRQKLNFFLYKERNFLWGGAQLRACSIGCILKWRAANQFNSENCFSPAKLPCHLSVPYATAVVLNEKRDLL